MRIALITSEFPVLSETPFLNQITGLVRRGHEVSIFAERPQAGVDPHPDIARLGLIARYPEALPAAGRWRAAARLVRGHLGEERRILLRSLNPFLFWRRAWTLEQLCRTAGFLPPRTYDVCYCAFGQDAPRGLRARRAGAVRGPLAVAFRGADTTKYVAIRGRRVYAPVFREGALFLPVSDSLARRLIALGAPPERVVVHRTGIDLSRWSWRARTRAPTEPLRLVAVGRLVEKKGIGYVLDAMRRLADAGIASELEVAGDGPLRRVLEAQRDRLGLGRGVRLLGWQSQAGVREALERAHVLVAPSITAGNADEEGIPNVLKEALASGLPVVATRHGGIPELVEDGVSGYLVAERDSAGLAERLARLAIHPECWAGLAAAGRARVERDYDIERLNDRLVGLFAGLTPERDR